MCVLQTLGAPVVLFTFVAGMGVLRGDNQGEIMDKLRKVSLNDNLFTCPVTEYCSPFTVQQKAVSFYSLQRQSTFSFIQL